VDRTRPEETGKYAGFLIESVGRVFTSPMEQIFEAETKSRGINDRTIKQLKALLEPLIKLVGPHA
jgi:chemotaxis signal transduction protein